MNIIERNKQIKEQRKNGLSLTAIAGLHNLSKQRIYQILSKYKRTITENTRYDVYKRDKRLCQKCFNKFKFREIHIHHIDSVPSNNKLNNLVTLCRYCHQKLHGGVISDITKKKRIIASKEEEKKWLSKMIQESIAAGRTEEAELLSNLLK